MLGQNLKIDHDHALSYPFSVKNHPFSSCKVRVKSCNIVFLITRLVCAVIVWFQLEPLHKSAFSDLVSRVGVGSRSGASVTYFVNWFLEVF